MKREFALQKAGVLPAVALLLSVSLLMDTTFFARETDAQFTFVRDETGKVVQLNIRRTTREFKARKIK